MVKYIIEGGGNFNEELYKSLDNGEKDKEEKKDKEDDGECLITGMPLTENFVKMECGHKFNYVPLYNDILNHKKKFNMMEIKVLKNIEIRCPYCRNIQKNLLPYHKYPGVKEVHGVNYFDNFLFSKYDNNMCFVVGICEYAATCHNTSVLHLKENNKHYCLYHKYKIITELSIQHKQKIKQAKIDLIIKQNAAKLLAKEQAKIAKDQAKIDKELAKEQAKNQAKVAKNQAKELVQTCSIILKAGKNKNCQCSNKIHKESMCSRHYKLAQPVEIL